MTELETSDGDVNRAIRSWLHEDRHEDASRVAGAVLDQVEAAPHRATWWPARRRPIMNRFATIGLAAAAVVVAVVIGAQLVGSPGRNTGGPDSEATQAPESSMASTAPEPTPSPTPWTGIPAGPYVVTEAGYPVQVTVDIGSPRWTDLAGLGAVSKDDDGLDAPVTAGAAFLAWAWPAGTEFTVYGDPCRWSTTVPETVATTPDEIASALAGQAETEPTEPVDVTIGGYTGKALTLTVPMSYDSPTATREEKFADCDGAMFGFYGVAGESDPARDAQGAGQIDELWIVDVDGAIVILDATYSPATPGALVDEMRAMAESATFEAP